MDAAPLRLGQGGVGDLCDEAMLEHVVVVFGASLQELVALDVGQMLGHLVLGDLGGVDRSDGDHVEISTYHAGHPQRQLLGQRQLIDPAGHCALHRGRIGEGGQLLDCSLDVPQCIDPDDPGVSHRQRQLLNKHRVSLGTFEYRGRDVFWQRAHVEALTDQGGRLLPAQRAQLQDGGVGGIGHVLGVQLIGS